MKATYPPSSIPTRYHPRRVRRTRLQSALVSKVPEGVIQLKKRLVSLQDIPGGGVKLLFEDQTEAEADLVVGGDGIRSVSHSKYALLLGRPLTDPLGCQAGGVS